jgi:hypothetical protein
MRVDTSANQSYECGIAMWRRKSDCYQEVVDFERRIVTQEQRAEIHLCEWRSHSSYAPKQYQVQVRDLIKLSILSKVSSNQTWPEMRAKTNPVYLLAVFLLCAFPCSNERNAGRTIHHLPSVE